MSHADLKLIGHKGTQSALQALFKAGQLPHALLFYGPRGVGKRLAAELFARRLLCGADEEAPKDELSFNHQHPIYPQIEARSCPDYHVIEPESGKKSISIEQVRTALAKLRLSSDGDRAIIIDAAEQLTTAASNALLKTLEEPGQGIHLVLISHNLSKLLPTIVSRCRKFRFSPLSGSEMVEVLLSIMGDHSEEQLASLTKVCQGCPGEALRLKGGGEEALALLSTFFEKNFPEALNSGSMRHILALSDALQKSKLTELGVELLLRHIAGKSREGETSLKWAELYERTAERQRLMKEVNITPQIVFESAMADAINSLR